MKKILFTLFLGLALGSCSGQTNNIEESKKRTNTSSSVSTLNKKNSQKDNSIDVHDFLNFINRKWVDVESETPCERSNRSIEINGDSLIDETGGMETSWCKILNVKKVGQSTFEFEIKHGCAYGDFFKVEILDLKKKLVKWYLYNGIAYEASPYDQLCEAVEMNFLYKKPREIIVPENWIGKYYFEVGQRGATILISEKETTYESVALRFYAKYQLSASLVADTLALFYHKGLSGNEDELEAYSPLIKLYKDGDKYYIKSVLTGNPYETLEIEKY